MDRKEQVKMMENPFTPELQKRHCQPMRSRKATGEYENYVRLSDVFFLQLREQWTADRRFLTEALKQLSWCKHYLRDHCKASDELIQDIVGGKFDYHEQAKAEHNAMQQFINKDTT